MRPTQRPRRLKKELGLLDVFAITTGATLSAGFFLLPGIAAEEAGSAIVLSYMIAALPLIPAMLSKVELATAMPRAGGVYYFLDRSLGPLIGTIGGLGIWLVLILKVAFALVGIGAYLELFLPQLPIVPIAAAFAIALGGLNLMGTKKSGGLQVVMVLGLLILVLGFIAAGLPQVEPRRFRGMLDVGARPILFTSGLVYISYVGVTKVVSLSEEVEDPDRTLPRGILLGMGTVLVIYALGMVVMAGVIPAERLAGDLTPVATAAELLAGRWGVVLVSAAALLAFLAVANAGTLSAARYPLAMSRDRLLPGIFGRLSGRRTPTWATFITVALIIGVLLVLDPMHIAELASAFQLLTFGLVCVSVIVMRESRIESYDPGYRSPFYPWLHIVGIVAPIGLIVEMGWWPVLFSVGLILAGALWYRYYARARVARAGAILHVMERAGRRRYERLDEELRGILREKGLRAEDPFEEVVTRSLVVDLPEATEFEEVVGCVSDWLAERTPVDSATLRRRFLEGTRVGATPVSRGVALPHLRLDGLNRPEMALVRGQAGVRILALNPRSGSDEMEEHRVRALFFLVSPESDARQHLRMLAQIAERVDDEDFAAAWAAAPDERALRETLLREERFQSLRLSTEGATAPLVGRALRDVSIPPGCLVAVVHRDDEALIPRGDTVLRAGDRLTIIGEPDGIRALRARYGGG